MFSRLDHLGQIHYFNTGLGLNEEVQPSMETSTKFSDVKGVDEAKAELEEIVHYLRDPQVCPR
jgi:ATP-dependent Zn protease